MYTRLIVPLDGSQLSESILPYAIQIARTLRLPVDLLQVIDPEVLEALASPGRGFFLDVVEADLRRSTKDYLNTVASSFGSDSSIDCRIAVGNPAEVIVKRAEREPHALIAMSTHGRSGVQRWYLGSVADKVLHACRNPVLVVKGCPDRQSFDETAAITRILLPLDGSALAESALPHAVAFASALGAELEIMRVYTTLTHADYGERFAPDDEAMRENARQEAVSYLEERAFMIEQEGLRHVSCIVREGDAAAEIIDVAREMPQNLVAMCSHGRSGIGRWVLGGTADRVVRYSEDPVLVIRASV